MSVRRYRVPSAFVTRAAKCYKLLMKTEFICLNPGYRGNIKEGIDIIKPKFSELVKRLFEFQSDRDMLQLFEWLFPAIRHPSITKDVLSDAICYALLLLSIDGPLDLELYDEMFNAAKSSMSLVEFHDAVFPRWMEVPPEKWTSEIIDAFWADMRK